MLKAVPVLGAHLQMLRLQAAIMIQKVWRGGAVRSDLHHSHAAAVVMQRHWRGCCQQAKYKRLQAVTVHLQARFKQRQATRRAAAQHAAIVTIQVGVSGSAVQGLAMSKRTTNKTKLFTAGQGVLINTASPASSCICSHLLQQCQFSRVPSLSQNDMKQFKQPVSTVHWQGHVIHSMQRIWKL